MYVVHTDVMLEDANGISRGITNAFTLEPHVYACRNRSVHIAFAWAVVSGGDPFRLANQIFTTL